MEIVNEEKRKQYQSEITREGWLADNCQYMRILDPSAKLGPGNHVVRDRMRSSFFAKGETYVFNAEPEIISYVEDGMGPFAELVVSPYLKNLPLIIKMVKNLSEEVLFESEIKEIHKFIAIQVISRDGGFIKSWIFNEVRFLEYLGRIQTRLESQSRTEEGAARG